MKDVTKYIKQRGNNYYFIGMINGKHIRKSLKTKSYSKAVTKAEQLLGIKGHVGSPTTPQVYFIDAVNSYFATRCNKQDAWIKGYLRSERGNASAILSTLKRLQQFRNITYLSEIDTINLLIGRVDNYFLI